MTKGIGITDYSFEDIDYIFNKPVFEKELNFMKQDHTSVLLQESVQALNPVHGGVYVDCTFGAGGHTRKILESAECKVISLDRDPYTKKYADIIKSEYGDRFEYRNARFSNLEKILGLVNHPQVDGILMDFGVSSMQIDTPRRGFSFQHDGPLDMRMEDRGVSAEDFIATVSEEELAGIIFKYGDERKSRQIAKAIISERNKQAITTTLQLAKIISAAAKPYYDSIHPATRTFQAIRTYINEELNEIKQVLEVALRKLKPGGRLSVITFHSGEDKIVKQFMNDKAGKDSESFSRYMPIPEDYRKKTAELKIVNKKPITPSDNELKRNIRSRSAKLRVAEKLKSSKH
jgi:16S rRNA (cytosine1402-N4)-methyltransferase